MNSLNRLIKRNENVAWRVIDGETLIVNPKDSLIYPLNIVATRVWELINGENSCSDIIAIIDEEFEGEKTGLQQDILSFIDDLLNKGLATLV